MGLEIKGHINGLGDTPAMEDLVGIVNGMVNAYREGEIDEVYVVYNRFINTMSQKPTVQQLLPLPALENDSLEQTDSWDYLYEPNPQALLDSLLVRYLESQVYQAVVDNLASETGCSNGGNESSNR
ncbi:F-ATPase gamma subunit [Mannheimia haemolytica]|uniref:F-ATPase gamma subunit n=1 Tax=Mannheimia haemolytica TaxID=75985 RepID=A0A378MTS8_MANHA|nr:F-ATPase gamma subunit [Mannheimia haemolytica]